MLANEVFLGDGQHQQQNYSACLHCMGLHVPVSPTAALSTVSPQLTIPISTEVPSSLDPLQEFQVPHDGHLDTGSNYTGFIEVIGNLHIHFIGSSFRNICIP